ncbi:DUF3426 domain-containing protein [uncultured Pseudomonas sp.]|uniref:DUF3426 domain-containing protein n=1 Tax=uncultured Pseudomonas sp. TaxID=114707 RepID=UPI0025E02FBF|nr:DUF3426 domain-containing protein [uncultured Pseudomonas sp.]
MTDSFVTQCPHCQTSFKVNYAQLSVARGVVRCGSCLEVFNAAKQLVEQSAQGREPPTPLSPPVPAEPLTAVPAITVPVIEPPAAAQSPASAEPPARHAQSDTLDAEAGEDYWHVSELDLDALDLDGELARLEQREIQQAEAFQAAPPASLSARRDAPQTDQGDWIDSLPNDDVEPAPPRETTPLSARDRDPDLDQNTAEDLDDEPPLHETRTEPSLSLTPLPLDDTEPDVTPLEPRKPAQDNSARLSARDDDADDDTLDDEPADPRGRSEPAIRDKALLDLTDDPLQLDWQRPKPRWGRRLLWSTLVVLALGGLALQYVWYHFDHLARQDQYRPWFQQLCPQLGCKVPSKVDINQLKSSNLVVRSHPDFQGALVVDAIIYNRASFSQPFPLLELRFADTSGQLIASRRFKPGEYLSGEMAGKEEMPPQTPIHIALDILDPGAKAVNYSLNFRSPE